MGKVLLALCGVITLLALAVVIAMAVNSGRISRDEARGLLPTPAKKDLEDGENAL